jgi:hypothetical protein
MKELCPHFDEIRRIVLAAGEPEPGSLQMENLLLLGRVLDGKLEYLRSLEMAMDEAAIELKVIETGKS